MNTAELSAYEERRLDKRQREAEETAAFEASMSANRAKIIGLERELDRLLDDALEAIKKLREVIDTAMQGEQ